MGAPRDGFSAGGTSSGYGPPELPLPALTGLPRHAQQHELKSI